MHFLRGDGMRSLARRACIGMFSSAVRLSRISAPARRSFGIFGEAFGILHHTDVESRKESRSATIPKLRQAGALQRRMARRHRGEPDLFTLD